MVYNKFLIDVAPMGDHGTHVAVGFRKTSSGLMLRLELAPHGMSVGGVELPPTNDAQPMATVGSASGAAVRPSKPARPVGRPRKSVPPETRVGAALLARECGMEADALRRVIEHQIATGSGPLATATKAPRGYSVSRAMADEFLASLASVSVSAAPSDAGSVAVQAHDTTPITLDADGGAEHATEDAT